MIKKYKQIIAILLAFAMLWGMLPITTFATKETGKFLYEHKKETYDQMLASGLWEVESVEKKDAEAPTVEDGVIKMTSHDSIGFYWTRAEGVGEYSSGNSYVFDFDVTLTDSGDGSYWGYGASTRALYVAFGGYYNQIELNTETGKVRTGDTYIDYDETTYENQKVHAQVILEGTTVTSTLTDANGNEIMTGSRSHSDFADMNIHEKCMTYLVLRCEDGGVEIENFRFSMKGTATISSVPFTVKKGSKVEYAATLDYMEDDKTVLKIGDTSIFSIENTSMRICGSRVLGSYEAGIYGISVEVNPPQAIVNIEITLPDGGTVRRGYGSIPKGSAFVWNSTSVDAVNDESVHYKNVKLSEYELVEQEPEATGFSENVYNLVNSFSDARTTRLFAWTARESFLNDGDEMVLQYRIMGESEWNEADAKRQNEPTPVANEEYFKADVSGLLAGTEYEYKIGVKGSDKEECWSEVYTFKTADDDLSSFEFVAIGDTQGYSWGGNTVSTKGYMYAEAALKKAFEDADKVHFILHTGDVTDIGYNLDMWNWYFKAIGAYSTSTAHFATIGNHDTFSGNNNNYFGLHFNHPDNGSNALNQSFADKITDGTLKVQFTQSEDTIYSYNYGEAHFIVLNSGAYIAEDKYILEAQREWLIQDLEENEDAKWKIILVHEPVYHRKGGAESRPWLYDVIEGHGVDLVIQGHSHLVSRTYPMKDGSIVTKTSPDVIEKGSGTVYTTIGSTTLTHDSLGDPNVEECMHIISSESGQASYTVVSVEDDKLIMTVKQLNGYVLDRFEIVSKNEEHIHNYESVVTEATCTADGYTTHTCSGCGDSYTDGEVAARGHAWDEGIITFPATVEKPGIKTYTCMVCKETKEESIAFESVVVERIWGESRYMTSLAIADELKEELDLAKFDTVIVANGKNFPDALAGSYLAAKKNAPILMVDDDMDNLALVQDYITNNLAEKGKVYILGGNAAVPESMEQNLEALDYEVERLKGKNRYETNIAILNEAGVTNEALLVCTGINFADSLSASATGMPILLVDPEASGLNAEQKAFLMDKKTEMYIIGGEGAVSEAYKEVLKVYDKDATVKRVKGQSRYETSVEVAKEFFETPDEAVIAYAVNFPDGLCGGPLAYMKKAPLVLTAAGSESVAADYIATENIKAGKVLGGTGVLRDNVVKTVFAMGEEEKITGTRYKN